MGSSKGRPLNDEILGKEFRNKQGCSFIVVKYEGANSVTIEFAEPYAYTMKSATKEIKNGCIKNLLFPQVYGVGYLGIGYDSKPVQIEGFDKLVDVYAIWVAMLGRCYSEKVQIKSPSYIGCTVSRVWHNYQNLLVWYKDSMRGKQGYEVDKDILVEGNKLYGPDTCCIIPCEINCFFTATKVTGGRYLTGVQFHSRLNKYEACIGGGSAGKKIYLGVYATEREASEVYKEAKRSLLKGLINKWQDNLDNTVCEALLKLTVKEAH